MRRTPPLTARGIYQLKHPFDVSAPPSKIFICSAIRSFKDIYELGQDVYGDFYLPMGLTQATFQADEAEGAAIITLFSEDNDVVYVPDTYILAYPDMGVVDYQRTVLSLDLGTLPEYVSLDLLKQQLATQAKQTVGADVDVAIHAAPHSGAISPDQHQTLEAARLNNIEIQETDLSQYRAQLTMNADLVQRIQTLEQIILDNGLLPE